MCCSYLRFMRWRFGIRRGAAGPLPRSRGRPPRPRRGPRGCRRPASNGFDQFTLLGFFAIQFILPITIGLIEYLDHPVARVFGKTLREVRKAEKRAKALAKKLPALRERLDVAEARLIMIEARAEEEVELNDRIVCDAK